MSSKDVLSKSGRARSHSPTVRPPAIANHSMVGAIDIMGGSMRIAAGSFRPGGDDDDDDEDFLTKTQRQVQVQMRALKMQSFVGVPITDKSKILAAAAIIQPPNLKDPQTINAGNIYAVMEKKKKELCEGKVLEEHAMFIKDAANVKLLEEGGHMFSFTCKEAKHLTDYERKLLEAGVNLSAFSDEMEHHGVPIINFNDVAQMKQYTYIIALSSYILPGVMCSDITPKLLSSYAFQKASQPAASHVHDDVTDENTFRMTKTIIRFVFSLTMQFLVSRLADEVLPSFSALLGVPIHMGLVLERTRRTAGSKPDSTAKAKSLLLYSGVKGGVLCFNITLLVQSSLPSIVSKLMNSFGSMGEAEVGESARNTRKFLKGKFSK